MSGGGGGSNEMKATDEERELSRIAVDRWNDYQSRLAPFEDQYMRQVQMTPGDHQQARGQAAVATEQAFAPAREQAEQQMFDAGVRPGSAAHTLGMGQLRQDQGHIQGVGVGEGHLGAQAAHMAGLQNIVNIGQGQAADAQAGLGQVAASSAADAQHRAGIAAQNRAGRQQLAGTLMGAGTRYGMERLGE
ncbi:hypothetical protein [Thioalkalivibrio sp. ARh3]|uniref:hypothetical protein n=1 Tax=Thioalkalivibrio sp. ARh3 TaxID=1158148 RepID=UPI00037342C7|nr:hypothetical protein [Thioalkalivibrio sp. ARh3]